ncbi:hypothetical protein GOQ30_11610 [Flavobacterium sp. TP390]|uniref:DUF4375 domain-containing protein n=1 Tax=Flavobacterium profundi TaxID=1774945 RepID=A0A6I4ISL3_9FLAO|nr:hypothetical protein [Flavobacterium profundi]MVO09806.1 hypothetical protein [Flavobacterium profundi]
MEYVLEKIIEAIDAAKPNLPSKEILSTIAFKWNNNELTTWDGGFDLNEKKREKIVHLLAPNFIKKDSNYLEILRFLLSQEIENCCEGEFCTTTLRNCYDYLANYKNLEDVLLLLSANDDTSFDANSALFKDRLFYNGYTNVIKYIKSQKNIDKEIIERFEYYGNYFGYNAE